MAGSALSVEHEQPGPSAGDHQPLSPQPRQHSVVCCCLLCEQYGTGEQAMRSVRGDYAQFLALVVSPTSQAAAPMATEPSSGGKSSRQEPKHQRRSKAARLTKTQLASSYSIRVKLIAPVTP